MFSAEKYKTIYRAEMQSQGVPVQILVSTGDHYTTYPARALVTRYDETTLIAGGVIQLGDLKVMFLAEDLEELGIARLGLSDRILIDGLNYAVIHWDQYTRSVGSTDIAVEAIIRGGGSA